MLRNLLFIIGILLITSCDSEETKGTLKRSYIVVNGDTLHVRRFENEMLSTVVKVDGEELSAQGCAIKDNCLYRFYDRGYCKVFQIHEDFSLTFVKEFKLASYRDGNHMNGVQFYPNSDILYSSEFYRRDCNVERLYLSEGKSEYLQTIHIADTDFLSNCKLNIFCGDDRFLWVFGAPGNELGKMCFVKYQCPELSLKEITLSGDDVLDQWSIVDDICMQGGKIKNGFLYFLSGSARNKKRLMVFDIHKKILSRNIILDDVIFEEPEDCDIYNNYFVITVYGSSAYYVIDSNNF